jgi:hypothetical protein
VVEIMAINLRQNDEVKGLMFENQPVLITQLADDTTLFLRDRESLEQCLHFLNHFKNCAGLKLNKTKPEVLRLGACNNISLSNLGMKEVNQTKSLGIIITKNVKSTIAINFNDRIKKIRNLLNMWQCRGLSIKGKITLLKSKALPLILYIVNVLFVPNEVIATLEQLFFSFIWPKQKHHVSRKVLTQSIENGGLKMINIGTMIQSLKLTWIKRLLQSNTNYARIAKTLSRIDDFENFFAHNLSNDLLPNQPSDFYRQLIAIWQNFKTVTKTVNEILNEKITQNKHILVDNKPIKSLNNKVAIIKDLLKEDNTFKTHEQLSRDITLSTLQYNSLISAIPRDWIKEIRKSSATFCEIPKLTLRINNTLKHITLISCKEFYKELIDREIHTPTATLKWEELYYYVNFNWSHIFRLPYLSVRETNVQSLQYQILHRYFPCREQLAIWYPDKDQHCYMCVDSVDSLEHFFYHCNTVTKLWSDLMDLINNTYSVQFKLGCLDVLFGITNVYNESILSVLNFCILQCKMFIRIKKLEEEHIVFIDFEKYLLYRLEIERFLLKIDGRYHDFGDKWGPLYDAICSKV